MSLVQMSLSGGVVILFAAGVRGLALNRINMEEAREPGLLPLQPFWKAGH